MTELLVKECWELSDGNKIPVLGCGVFQVPNNETANVVKNALISGIRLIDTAQAYQNEEGVGEGIRASGVPREDVFITTKIWNRNQGYTATIGSFKESLVRLGTDYTDLVLIHWPLPKIGKYIET